MTAQRRPRTHHGISTGNAHLARLPNTYSCFQCVCSRRFESICGLIVMVNRTSIPDCTVQGHSGDDHDGGDCWCSLNLVQIWSKFGPNLVQIWTRGWVHACADSESSGCPGRSACSTGTRTRQPPRVVCFSSNKAPHLDLHGQLASSPAPVASPAPKNPNLGHEIMHGGP